jgi:hypothetical protein
MWEPHAWLHILAHVWTNVLALVSGHVKVISCPLSVWSWVLAESRVSNGHPRSTSYSASSTTCAKMHMVRPPIVSVKFSVIPSIQLDELLAVSMRIFWDGTYLDPVCSHLSHLMTTISDPLLTTHSHFTFPPRIASMARRLSISLVVTIRTSTGPSSSGNSGISVSIAAGSFADAESTRLVVMSCRNSFWTNRERATISLAERVTRRLSK